MPPRSAAASPAPVSGVACHTDWSRQSRDRRRKAQTRERYDVIWEQKPGALWRPAHLLLDVVPNGVRAVFLDVTTKADIQSRIILSSDCDGEPPRVHRAQESPSAYLDVGTQSGTTRINDCDDSAGQTMYLASYDWTRNDWTGEFRLRLSARPSPALDLACSKSSVKLSFCCVTEEGSLIEGAMKRRIKELNREQKRAGECRWPAHRWTIGARCEVYCAARKNWNHGMVVALKSDVTGRPTIVVHYVQASGGGMKSRTLLDNAFDLRAAETHVHPNSLRQSVVGGNILVTKCLRSSFKVAAEKTVEGFHGTTLENALQILQFGFRPSRNGMLGRGVYWSDNVMKTIPYASCDRSGRRRPMGSGVVLKLEIWTGHTKTIDRRYHPSRLTWNAEGYDTAWVPAFCGMVPSGLSENCTYDSSRVTVTAVSTNYGESFATGDRLECLAKLLAHEAAMENHRTQEWQANVRRALARLNLNPKIERAALDAAACSVVCWLLPVVCGMALTLIGAWSLFSDIAVLSILIGWVLMLVGLLGFDNWWGHSLSWRKPAVYVSSKLCLMLSIMWYLLSIMIYVAIDDQTTLDSERPICPVGPALMTLGLFGIMYAMCNEISAMGLTPLWLQRPLEFLGHRVPIVCWVCMLLGGMLSHQIGLWSLFADYALWSGLICLPLCFVAAHGFDHCISAAGISVGWQEGDEGLLIFRVAFGFFFFCAWFPTLVIHAFGCPVMGSVPTLVVDDDGWVITKWLLPQQIEQVRDKMSATAAPECTNTCKLYNASADLNQTVSPLVNNSVCQDGGYGDLSPSDLSSSSRAFDVDEQQCQLGADTIDCGCRDGKSVADWVPPPDLKRKYGWLSRFDADGGECGKILMIWDGFLGFPLLLFVCWCMYKQIPIMRRARVGLCFPRRRADDMERSNGSRAESEASKRERSQYGAHANDSAGHAAGRTTELVNPLMAADIEIGQVA